MRKILLGTIALVASASGTAMAADLPPRGPIYPKAPPPVVSTWTGLYFGGHLGGGWGQKIFKEPPGTITSGGGNTITVTGMTDADGPVSGFLGGAQVGFNLQLSPRWVGGIEADVSGANINGSFPCFNGIALIKGEPSSDSCSAQSKTLGTIVARFGPTVGNAWVYLLGGGAWIRDHYHDSYFFPDRYGDFVVGYSASETRWGWTVGGGIEYAIDANWSAKVQYNYMDFGTKRLTFNAPGGDPAGDCPCSYTEDISQRIHTVKVGLNYRWANSVVAGY